MKKKICVTLVLMFSITFSIPAISLNHSTGIEVSFFGNSSFNNDPYSLPSGFGLFYTVNKFSKSSLFLGTSLVWYGFVPSNTFYTGSIMIIPTVSVGYNFLFDLTHKSVFSLLPYISYGQYIRSIETNEDILWFSRPVITGGFDFLLNTEIRTTSVIGLFISVIMDNTPIFMPGFRVKTGYAGGKR